MRLSPLLLLVLCVQLTQGQLWRTIGHPVSSTEVQTLFGDSVSDKLLAGGTFKRIALEDDTTVGFGQASWNGVEWDSVAYRIQSSAAELVQQTYWFLRFQGNLYACGGFGFYTPSGDFNRGLARLNEGTARWEALECLNPSTSSLRTLVAKEPQDDLFLTGYEDAICGYPTSCVFRHDGSAFYPWVPFDQIPDDPGNYVGYVFDYQGFTYMTGSYRDPLGPGIATFMRFNGTTWEHVPGWNSQSPIKEISIHNDTLYLAGAFTIATGGPGNYVAYFDGATWNGMAGGMSLPIAPGSCAVTSLQWFHNKLYAGGVYTHASGQPMGGGIAWWDGTQWCGFPTIFNGEMDAVVKPTVADIAVWRDSLFITGSYRTAAGQTIKEVAQWLGGDASLNCGPSAVPDELTGSIRMLPNPATDNVTIVSGQGIIRRYRVLDMNGRQVAANTVNMQRFTMERNGLAAGSYFVELDMAGGTVVRKLMLD